MSNKHYKKGPWILLVGILAIAAFTTAVMLLWNWLIPTLFNGPRVNWWQSLGLLALSKILLGFPHFIQHKKMHMERKMMMASMSDEQKEELKRKLEERCALKWDRDG